MSDEQQGEATEATATVDPEAPATNGKAVVGEVATARQRGKARVVRPTAASVEVPQGELPDTIEESDAAYHRQVVQDFNNAQAALQSWMRFCAMKYRLGMGNRIDETGKILRDVPPEMLAQMGQQPPSR